MNNSDSMETVGKVNIDLTYYPGEDFYSDGEIEDELLRIAKEYSPEEIEDAIAENRSWPLLYHFSPLRENIVDWIPFSTSDKVLEVGSGCGAITGALSRKAGRVDCVDLSKKRSLINAYRHKEMDNITIHVGNFKDIEPSLDVDYDYICLIGVFEYGGLYIGGETPYEDFIRILRKHLKSSGRIIIAIENKFGLKYFAGCREDHYGTFFSGIENYPENNGIMTFSRRGLEKIFKRASVKEYTFYYPYPDYKFMDQLYSDAYQPNKGELWENTRNFDRNRMSLFDEKRAFDGIIEDDCFPIFSNSFMAVIGKGFDVKYAKYSNDRADEFSIRTEIFKDEKGKIFVRKYPATVAALEHVKNMQVAYESLKERYKGSGLFINKCTLHVTDEVYAQFEFVEGKTLSELMDECIKRGDTEGFYNLFDEYLNKVGYNNDSEVADLDLIFSNIIVSKETWTVIDYEWTFGKAIDVKELATRALYVYLLENDKRKELNLAGAFERLGIDEQMLWEYENTEKGFQDFVAGEHVSLALIGQRINNFVAYPECYMGRMEEDYKSGVVQVYEDKGNGFNEKDSCFVSDAYITPDYLKLEYYFGDEVTGLRIDPATAPCIVKIKGITLNGKDFGEGLKNSLITNGRLIKSDGENGYEPTLVFATADPYFAFEPYRNFLSGDNAVTLEASVTFIPGDVAFDLSKTLKHDLAMDVRKVSRKLKK